jgi:ubiquinone/menaquinone biosynthesis C-methylase UbiE
MEKRRQRKFQTKVDKTVIERLAEFWPEPREQLHFGGWNATYDLFDRIGLEKADHVLDICCGEGGTAIWLGEKYKKKVSGVDILGSAIEVASKHATENGVGDIVEFKIADIFDLPYGDSAFDIVYGQDADGLAHKDRSLIFKEIARVLKPQGVLAFQLWIPCPSMPEDKVEYFEQVTIKAGFPEMTRLSVKEFIDDLLSAGFTNIIIDDLSEIYKNHMIKMAHEFSKKLKTPDAWHNMLLDLIEEHYEFGVRIIAKVKKQKEGFMFSKELPLAKDLYFYGTGVFSPDFIFDFDTIAEEREYRNKILFYLRKKYPKFRWSAKGEGVLASGTVDNYSPPKVGSFLRADLNKVIQSKNFNIKIGIRKYLDCWIDEIYIDFYRFNCAIVHFIVYIPEESWQDKETLERVRFFIQKHNHPLGEFGIDLESIFAITISELNTIFKNVINVLKLPILKTPFLDFTNLSEEIKTKLFWTHCTIVATMPKGFDVNSEHFQGVLLNLNPKGIYNYSILPNIFAYVESGDSLICLLNEKDIQNRNPKTIANEDWIPWIAIHHYTWKTVWELDRGFYILLNVVTSHLKHKRTEQYHDVYAVNALINHIILVLDTHKSRNLTSTYYSMYFIEQISDAWRTGEILEAATSKMEILKDLIGQLDEIESSRRSRRVELFLTFLGVFALGSLVLDFIGAISFGELMPDWIKFGFRNTYNFYNYSI